MALPFGKFLWIVNFILNTFLIVISMAHHFIIILPEIYKIEFLYYFFVIIELFICFNIIGNLLACGLVDTSINYIKDKPPKDSTQHASWHFCRKCDMLVPPRSLHCDICKICILKRDHHCSFLGRCIGHRNSRYFLIFVFYAAIGTVLSSIHNIIYFWWLHNETYGNWNTVLKLIFPVLLLWSIEWQSAFLLAFELNLGLAIISCVILAIYSKCFLSGATRYEFYSNKNGYDFGSKKHNMEIILGKRMYLVWLAPFIKSELSHDGVNWESSNEEIL